MTDPVYYIYNIIFYKMIFTIIISTAKIFLKNDKKELSTSESR